MERTVQKMQDDLSEDSSVIIRVNERQKEKELVTLIANILVTKTWKDAAEKGYSLPPF
jgi:hypothetical protein